MVRRELFYCREKSWRSFINMLVEKLLLQASNQVEFLHDKEPHVVLKMLKKHIY